MTSGEVAYLSAAVAAFIVFAIALAAVEFSEKRKLRKSPPSVKASQSAPPLAKAA